MSRGTPYTDGEVRGHLATPDPQRHPAPWPGVVVIHEIFGLTADIRVQADRFAEHGYLALAVDLFHHDPRCIVGAIRGLMQGGGGPGIRQIDAAREALARRDDCTGRVGVIGFCFGGGYALLAATSGFDVSAVNYGMLPRDPLRRLQGACPIVASYGAKDQPYLRGAAARLDAVLGELGVDRDVKEYPNAGHGFMTPHTGWWAWATRLPGMATDPEAAEDAWSRVFAFFDRHLR